MIDNTFVTVFRRRLLSWAAAVDRPMPWKGERDPYLVWLSEIILQQTRVEQGWAYYEAFRDRYPSVVDLAAAPQDEVMKLWEGLGYYSRARNLHAAARKIRDRYQGRFPSRYEEIIDLPGVGPYTAAAIASFAFRLPHAVLDGNVFRILSRLLGLATPIDTTRGKKEFAAIAEQLLDKEQPDRYNQAIMDFGAVQCIPRNPSCGQCPFQDICEAHRQGLVQQLPVKERKLVKKDRYFQYFLLHWQGQVIIRKRTDKDIWRNLYDFPLIETSRLETAHWRTHALWDRLSVELPPQADRKAGPFRQQLTHQRIIAFFRELALEAPPAELPAGYVLTDRKNLSKFAFPKLIDCYLRDNSLNLF